MHKSNKLINDDLGDNYYTILRVRLFTIIVMVHWSPGLFFLSYFSAATSPYKFNGEMGRNKISIKNLARLFENQGLKNRSFFVPKRFSLLISRNSLALGAQN